MFRAVLEGVALNFRRLARAVERFSRRAFSRYVFYGGGAASSCWAQILADVLQRPVHQVAAPRFTVAVGNALLGFHRCGRVELPGLARRIAIRRVYEPQADDARRYDDLFGHFLLAFKRNRALFHALNH